MRSSNIPEDRFCCEAGYKIKIVSLDNCDGLLWQSLSLDLWLTTNKIIFMTRNVRTSFNFNFLGIMDLIVV